MISRAVNQSDYLPLSTKTRSFLQASKQRSCEIMPRVLPVTARLWAKILGNLPLSAHASEVLEIAPAVDRAQPSAIALPEEFDRVLAVPENSTISMEHERLKGGIRRHAPTRAYQIDHAVIGHGTLYFDGDYQVIRGRSTKPLLGRRPDCFGEMQLCSDYYIDRYFGHWAMDGLVLELLASQRSLPAVTLAGRSWLHEADYRELCDLKVERSEYARIERLWVLEYFEENNGWISPYGRNPSSPAIVSGPKWSEARYAHPGDIRD